MIREVSPDGRRARRQALPFVYVGLAGVVVNAVASDNRPALGTWQFLVGAALALVGVVFMTVWTRELPSRVAPLPALGGMLSAALMAAATGGAESGAVALLLLPLMWFGYEAVGGQVLVGAAGFAVAVSAAWYSEPAARRLHSWDEWAMALLVGGGLLYGVWRIAQDRRELTERVAESARTDPLTGLLNRRGFEEAVTPTLARAKRARETVGLLMLDVDGFKLLNDTRGHLAGDELLIEVAGAWRACLRAGDLICRAGGDEFVVLLVGTDRARAEAVAQRLRRRTPSGVSCSVGVALSQPEDADLDRLVSAADDALYAAKATGRDRAVLASDSTLVAAESRRDAAVAAPGAGGGSQATDLETFEPLFADAGVVRFTALSDRFVSVPPGVEQILGWRPEELLATTFAELLHPDDSQAALAVAARVMQPGAVVHSFDARFRCRDGRYRRLRFFARSDGTLWHAIAVDLGGAGNAEPVAA